jgi:hypothetical protein
MMKARTVYHGGAYWALALNRKSNVRTLLTLVLCTVLWDSGASAQNLAWAAQQKIPGVGTYFGPSLAVFQNQLFAAWKGAGNDQGIYYSSAVPR